MVILLLGIGRVDGSCPSVWVLDVETDCTYTPVINVFWIFGFGYLRTLLLLRLFSRMLGCIASRPSAPASDNFVVMPIESVLLKANANYAGYMYVERPSLG